VRSVLSALPDPCAGCRVHRNEPGSHEHRIAALTMNQELGIAPEGVRADLRGLLRFGYLLFEVPSNLILHRVGARLWIAGSCSPGAPSPHHRVRRQRDGELWCRVLLGICEAGFYPACCCI